MNQIRLKSTLFYLTFKPPATRLKLLLTDLSHFQHKCPLGVFLYVLGKDFFFLFLFYIYDDSELLERYRFNRSEILYITDLLHEDLCPLTGRS